MRVTVTFANGTSLDIDVADGSLVQHLQYELIVRRNSPLFNKTGDYNTVHVAGGTDQATPLAGGLALVAGAVYYADLPTCTICQVVVTDNRLVTSCHHLFHRSCLTGWVGQGQRNCPNCRTELPNSMNNVSVYNSAGIAIGETTDATYTLAFASITLNDFRVLTNNVDPQNRYTIYAEYIAGVAADYSYTLPTMTAVIDPNQFDIPMTFTKV